MIVLFFFFNDTATTEIYTLSLHDALPILPGVELGAREKGARLLPLLGSSHGSPTRRPRALRRPPLRRRAPEDRKSTRLNSSHANISYAVFCLKKKKKQTTSPLRS